ncbi:MAG: hypothetical protein P4L85_02845 [Paludisphaera borealis]|uniref:DnaJ domain-containing protein n=1 Tax=Paludisphaera borealis TaxID=1387353 RepID=UPI0028424C7B|nr:DnaJ domain-containing protein [Paludisphaera borealis]MDR3618260.1 hypothetical protein [Paludisphaera borealis]
MFLRFRKMRGKTYWQVIESYRDGKRLRHRTVFRLGAHETREAAQLAWDEAVAKQEESRSGADGDREACLAALGLTFPTTLEQVRAAYRRKAVEIHPDRGGTHEAMVELNQAYQAAREMVRA